MSTVMQQLYARQTGGPAAGTSYFSVGGRAAGQVGGIGLGAGADLTGAADQRWTGIIVAAALVIALVGWHGMRGG